MGATMRLRVLRAFGAAAVMLGMLLCVGGSWAQHYVPTTDPAFPRLKFADSLLSPNDRCLVTHRKLNPRVRPVYVNGVPMAFC